MTYSTANNVYSELGVASSTITASSIPSTSNIATWLSEADAEIDAYTGRVWASTAVSSSAPEYYDYDGSGHLLLEHRPVLSVQKVEVAQYGVGDNSDSWVELTEGRSGTYDFELYKEQGMIRFHPSTNGNRPLVGSRTVRVTYTYGYSTTPLLITRLATLLVADRYITTFANASAGQLGGTITVGPISVSDSSSFSINRLNNIRQEKQRLFDMIGRTKVFSPTFDI